MIWSITTHEVAHGWVADKLGDPTARRMGRLTLNPIPHIDLVYTILIPGLLILSGLPAFGGAKPVPVDLRNLRRTWRDWALVGLAGPVSNLLIGFLLVGLYAVFVRTGRGVDTIGCMVLAVGSTNNFALACFNLLPIPPLDGSRVATYFTNDTGRRFLFSLERFGLFLVMGLVLFWRDGLNWYFNTTISPLLNLAAHMFGVPGQLNATLDAYYSSR